jgi:hypothetical protein
MGTPEFQIIRNDEPQSAERTQRNFENPIATFSAR